MKARPKLLIPAAGLSSRYGGRPKFLLRHPTGDLMLEKAVTSMGRDVLSEFEELIVITRGEILEQEEIEPIELALQLSDRLNIPVRVHVLAHATSSMVETLAAFIEDQSDDAPFVIRDSDNYVTPATSAIGKDFLVYADLKKFTEISPANKGFVQIDSFGEVIGLVEKEIIGNLIYIGMAGFESYSRFLYASKILGESSRENYVTDVIRTLVNEGFGFQGIECSAYRDWGTERDWSRECSSHLQLVCDLEGYLIDLPNLPQAKVANFRATDKLQLLKDLLERSPDATALILTSAVKPDQFCDVENWLAEHKLQQERFQLIAASTGVPRRTLGEEGLGA